MFYTTLASSHVLFFFYFFFLFLCCLFSERNGIINVILSALEQNYAPFHFPHFCRAPLRSGTANDVFDATVRPYVGRFVFPFNISQNLTDNRQSFLPQTDFLLGRLRWKLIMVAIHHKQLTECMTFDDLLAQIYSIFTFLHHVKKKNLSPLFFSYHISVNPARHSSYICLFLYTFLFKLCVYTLTDSFHFFST